MFKDKESPLTRRTFLCINLYCKSIMRFLVIGEFLFLIVLQKNHIFFAFSKC